MSYSLPNRMSYTFGEEDIADAARALSVRGPTGKDGRLVAVSISSTETFNAVTTPAHLLIGTAADTDAYADVNVGTLAATDSLFKSYFDQNITIPKDTQVEITEVAPTGGTPAGKAYFTVTIDWAD
ncbi:MAG: hypothetical protein LCH99_15465 [Proteobacteria bacterium]|nr:hypothetical protein [Pseudomonadota bacterium]